MERNSVKKQGFYEIFFKNVFFLKKNFYEMAEYFLRNEKNNRNSVF
jgi:hypothetical protein